MLILHPSFHPAVSINLKISTTAGSGQHEPSRIVLEVGGLQLSRQPCAWKAEVPLTSSTSLGGSRWPDPAVFNL